MQNMSETFLIPEEFSEAQLKLYICVHVKYQPFLPDFNETNVFLRDFLHMI
jgi:hypothetical protein